MFKRSISAILAVTASGLVAFACSSDGDLGSRGSSSGTGGESGFSTGAGEWQSCMLGQTQSCYGAPLETRNVGVCKEGTQKCAPSTSVEVSLGTWGECTGAILPGVEACNQLDDDCDGAVDEGCPCTAGATRACGAAPTTPPCHQGQQACGADGTWDDCEGELGPVTEICDNGVDDDCNGSVDEGCSDGGTVDCSTLSCTPTVIALNSVYGMSDFALDATHVFWAASSSPQMTGSLKMANKDGTGAMVLSTSAALLGAQIGAADDAHAYWTAGVNNNGFMGKIGKDGTGLTTLWSATGTSLSNLLSDAPDIFFIARSSFMGRIGKMHVDGTGMEMLTPSIILPLGLSQDADHLYFGSAETLWRLKKDGTELIALWSGTGSIRNTAVYAGSIYWNINVEVGIGSIMKANIDGSGAQVIASVPHLWESRGVVADATGLYWTSYSTKNPSTLMKAHADGSAVTTIASQGVVQAVALDDTYVYWGSFNDIKRVPKCCFP